ANDEPLALTANRADGRSAVRQGEHRTYGGRLALLMFPASRLERSNECRKRFGAGSSGAIRDGSNCVGAALGRADERESGRRFDAFQGIGHGRGYLELPVAAATEEEALRDIGVQALQQVLAESREAEQRTEQGDGELLHGGLLHCSVTTRNMTE